MNKQTKKAIVAVSIIGIIGYVAYKFWMVKKVGSSYVPPSPYVPPTPTPTPTPTGNDLSLSDISLINQDIFNAMDGYGTDEQGILDSFSKLKTNNDFDRLTSSFGVKTISSGAGNIFTSDFTGNLSQCLRNELSEYWITEINKTLASHNIQRSI